MLKGKPPTSRQHDRVDPLANFSGKLRMPRQPPKLQITLIAPLEKCYSEGSVGASKEEADTPG